MSTPTYLNVPTCIACGSKACVPAASYGQQTTSLDRGSRDLVCVVCRWIQVGTQQQVDQAKEAERSWETRTDGTKGPWANVIRRRAKKEKAQLRLFRTNP